MVNLVESLTEDKLQSLWSKLPHSGSFWGYYRGMTYERFRAAHTSAKFLLEFPFGVVRVTRYQPGVSAEFHPLFWSPQAFRDIESIEQGLQLLSEKTQANRLECLAVRTHRAPESLLRKVGFSITETLPNAYTCDAGCYDLVKYVRILEREV